MTLGRRTEGFCEQSNDTVAGVSSGLIATGASLPPELPSNSLRWGKLLKINIALPILQYEALFIAVIFFNIEIYKRKIKIIINMNLKGY